MYTVIKKYDLCTTAREKMEGRKNWISSTFVRANMLWQNNFYSYTFASIFRFVGVGMNSDGISHKI